MIGARTATGANRIVEMGMSRMSPYLVRMQSTQNDITRQILKMVEMAIHPPQWMRETREQRIAILAGFTWSRNLKRFRHPFRRF